MKRNIHVTRAHKEMRKKRPDLQKTFEWLCKAAEANDAEALYAIGTWYLHGRFVKKNARLGVQYLLQAAVLNYPVACYDLAVSFEKGVGITKSHRKAFQNYLNAALRGNDQACYEVGRCYYYGIGVTKNLSVAKVWLDYAKSLGVS